MRNSFSSRRSSRISIRAARLYPRADALQAQSMYVPLCATTRASSGAQMMKARGAIVFTSEFATWTDVDLYCIVQLGVGTEMQLRLSDSCMR